MRISVSRISGKWTDRGEYACRGGDGDAGCMADVELFAVFPAIADGQFSKALDRGGRALLSGIGRPGGSGSPECSHRAEPAPGSAHYEQELMRKQRFIGPCPEVLILTILEPKVALCGTECSW